MSHAFLSRNKKFPKFYQDIIFKIYALYIEFNNPFSENVCARVISFKELHR